MMRPAELKEQLRKIRMSWRHVLMIVILLLPFIMLWANLKFGLDKILVTGRNFDGTTSIENFLVHGQNIKMHNLDYNIIRWIGLFMPKSPDVDNTVFLGFLFLPLMIFAFLFHPGKSKFQLSILIFLLVLISFSTPLSILAYYFWPFM